MILIKPFYQNESNSDDEHENAAGLVPAAAAWQQLFLLLLARICCAPLCDFGGVNWYVGEIGERAVDSGGTEEPLFGDQGFGKATSEKSRSSV